MGERFQIFVLSGLGISIFADIIIRINKFTFTPDIFEQPAGIDPPAQIFFLHIKEIAPINKQ